MPSRKKTINLAVPELLLEQFMAVCSEYGHGKQKGLVLSAAMLMFLKADPVAQGRCIEEIMKADVADGVSRMIEKARREQGLRIATREATTAASSGRQRKKAAKKRSKQARRAVKKLKSIKDLR